MSSKREKLPSVSTGSGVPRVQSTAILESDTMEALGMTDTAAEPEEQPNSNEYTDKTTGRKFLLNKAGKAQWSDTPVMRDQFFNKTPGLVKYDPPVTEVFDLSVKEQLEAYNKLQARTFPVDSPSITMKVREEFYNGKFIVLVTYSNIWYLLPESK